MMNKQDMARRNAYTAIAILLAALTLIPYVGEYRIKWMMWRDTPLLAVVMVGVAIALVVASRRESAGTSAHDR